MVLFIDISFCHVYWERNMIVDSISKMEIHMVENSWIIWDGIGEIEYENDIQIQPL